MAKGLPLTFFIMTRRLFEKQLDMILKGSDEEFKSYILGFILSNLPESQDDLVSNLHKESLAGIRLFIKNEGNSSSSVDKLKKDFADFKKDFEDLI